MENNNKQSLNILRKFYSGGMQRYFPKNEAQIYMAKFTLDLAGYCLNDFTSSEINDNEKECALRLSQLNKDLINQ